MTDMNEQKSLKEENQPTAPDESYSFIKETRKKMPVGRSFWCRRILITAVLAIAAGLLAGLTCVLSIPLFRDLLGDYGRETEVIEIAAVTASSEEEEVEAAEEEKEEQVEEVDVLGQYRETYQEMAEIADSVRNSMVEVIGITSSLDYFNHDYENQQSLSGLIAAESQTSLYCLVENRNLKKAEKIQVIFSDGSRVTAEFKASDSETNLAVLVVNRVDIEDEVWNTISIAPFGNYSTLKQGTPVIAVGNIMGLGEGVEYGFLTSVENTVSLWDVNYNVLLTDMIGSSTGSGCLVNLNGEVVGMINQSIASEDQNLVTALPTKQLNTLIQELINDEQQVRFGIKGQTVTDDISDSSGIPTGVLVTEVQQESPAMFAGIKELDVIIAVNGESTDTFQAFRRIISGLSSDEEITVDAMRMGKENYEEISFQLKVETK